MDVGPTRAGHFGLRTQVEVTAARNAAASQGVESCTHHHSFVTDALENGVGMAQVAELLGHNLTDMVMQHHQHPREKRERRKQADVQATR